MLQIRLRKPMKQLNDGPQAKVNVWLRQFYNEASEKLSKRSIRKYMADW